MSKKKQDARFKKYKKGSDFFIDVKRIEEAYKVNKIAANSLAKVIDEITDLDLADKQGGLYYEVFDLDTRGDVFRIEVEPSEYAVNTRVYVNEKKVAEQNYLYQLDLGQDKIDVDTEKIIKKIPLEHWKPKYRDYRNNPSKQAIGGLLIAGLFGYAMMKRSL